MAKRNFKRERESLLLVAQPNAIGTNNIKAKIDNMQQKRKYSLCCDKDETINHKISERCKLSQKKYKTRHNLVRKVIH